MSIHPSNLSLVRSSFRLSSYTMSNPSIHPSIQPSIHPSIHPSIRPSQSQSHSQFQSQSLSQSQSRSQSRSAHLAAPADAELAHLALDARTRRVAALVVDALVLVHLQDALEWHADHRAGVLPASTGVRRRLRAPARHWGTSSQELVSGDLSGIAQSGHQYCAA